ncbi:hypothetical protein E2562_027079 [Oryza meyeriana var. granulata]|uniref:Uncharacterized protein n=1 Tax=Oryza meyeriana var. granulata TaxID=110450 RepID=A0A6G1EZD8_9ORYZ|nr:hypothetical protein E2562_027079 [Oryza meyeriana var. granulata]
MHHAPVVAGPGGLCTSPAGKPKKLGNHGEWGCRDIRANRARRPDMRGATSPSISGRPTLGLQKLLLFLVRGRRRRRVVASYLQIFSTLIWLVTGTIHGMRSH